MSKRAAITGSVAIDRRGLGGIDWCGSYGRHAAAGTGETPALPAVIVTGR